MRSTVLIIFCWFSLCSSLCAQRIEFIAAANYNQFLNADLGVITNLFNNGSNNNSKPVKNETYTGGYGYTCSIGLDDIKFGKVPFKFTLVYDHYSGGINYNDHGLGSRSAYNFNTKKDLLGLGIYPLNITWFDRLQFSLGTQFNFLIHAHQSGEQSGGTMYANGSGNTYYIATNSSVNTKEVNSIFYAGTNISLRYECKLSEEWRIAPQTMLYIPMSYEFKSPYNPTLSVRPYLGVVLIKKI